MCDMDKNQVRTAYMKWLGYLRALGKGHLGQFWVGMLGEDSLRLMGKESLNCPGEQIEVIREVGYVGRGKRMSRGQGQRHKG